jgi:hypothetical protein
VSNCTSLTSLDLSCCYQLTAEALRAVSSLPALTSLDLSDCYQLALRNTTAAPNLHIESSV